jgi:hypothetical protein
MCQAAMARRFHWVEEAIMETHHGINRPVGNATVNGEFQQDQLSNLLDELVAMRWDLSKGLSDVFPEVLADQLRRVSTELDVTIDTLTTLIREQALPL